MPNKYNFTKWWTTIEWSKFWDILINLSIINEKQLNEALIKQKQLSNEWNQLTIGQVISILYQIDFEKIEKIFVQKFLTQWIKKIIKNILVNDKFLNANFKNNFQKSVNDIIWDECLEIKISEWSRKIIKIIDFKEDWKVIYNNEILLWNIEWIFEIILNIWDQKITHKTWFIYDIWKYFINITASEIMASLRQDIVYKMKNI